MTEMLHWYAETTGGVRTGQLPRCTRSMAVRCIFPPTCPPGH